MSAWDVFWLLFIFVPLTIIWILILMDLLQRPDLFGWQKALWALGIIFFPWIGVLIYMVARPQNPTPATYGRNESRATPVSADAPVKSS
jgi:hypothetical protein